MPVWQPRSGRCAPTGSSGAARRAGVRAATSKPRLLAHEVHTMATRLGCGGLARTGVLAEALARQLGSLTALEMVENQRVDVAVCVATDDAVEVRVLLSSSLRRYRTPGCWSAASASVRFDVSGIEDLVVAPGQEQDRDGQWRALPGSSSPVGLQVDVLAFGIERLSRGHHVADVAQGWTLVIAEQAAEIVVRVVVQLAVAVGQPEVRGDPLADRIATTLTSRRRRQAQDRGRRSRGPAVRRSSGTWSTGAILSRIGPRPTRTFNVLNQLLTGCTVTCEHTALRTWIAHRFVVLPQHRHLERHRPDTVREHLDRRRPRAAANLRDRGRPILTRHVVDREPSPRGRKIGTRPVVEEPDVEAVRNRYSVRFSSIVSVTNAPVDMPKPGASSTGPLVPPW